MATSVSFHRVVVLGVVRRGGRVRRLRELGGLGKLRGLRARVRGGVGGLLSGRTAVGGPQRPVDVDKCVLLTLGQPGIGANRALHRPDLDLARAEDPRLDVERLGRDPQGLRDRLEHLGGGPPQSTLDLAEVRIRDPRRVGELPQREPTGLPLLTQVLAKRPDGPLAMAERLSEPLAQPTPDLVTDPLCHEVHGASRSKRFASCATVTWYTLVPLPRVDAGGAPARISTRRPWRRRP